jgi:hypothetical protein
MHALAGLTVLAASNFSGHNTDETIISNYGAGGSATDRIMQMRYSNSSPARLECVVNFSTSSSTASEATDITLTSGVKYGMGFSWDGAAGSNHLRMASNGTLSSVAGTASGTLRDPSPSPRLRTGIRSGAGYGDTVQVFGPIDGVVILPEAKPTDWLRMATRGIGAPAYTVGEFVSDGPTSKALISHVRLGVLSATAAPADPTIPEPPNDFVGLDAWAQRYDVTFRIVDGRVEWSANS